MKIDHQEWGPCSVPNAELNPEGKTLANDVEKQGCRNQASISPNKLDSSFLYMQFQSLNAYIFMKYFKNEYTL